MPRSPPPCANSRRAPTSRSTGVLDDKTVKAINSPKRDRQIDTVIVNMERWRWLPRQLGAPSLGNAYVILNIPDFTLKVMQNGAAGLDHAGRDRQARQPRHAATDGDDEVHHRQSDLERAALDHLQRISAGPAAGSDGAATHGAEAGAQPRRQHPHFAAARRSQCARPHPLQLPEQVPGLSARHAGQEPVRPATSAPSAMAACACRIPINTPRPCSTS